MAEHELGLLENAFDSLDEAIAKFGEGRQGNPRAFKFALLHLTHWVELLFKHYVAEGGEERIFVGKPNKDGERRTIGLFEAIDLLKDDGFPITPALDDDLRWIKALRNRVEHYKFTMNIVQIEDAVGRVIHGLSRYDEEHHKLGLEDWVDPERLEVFQQLAENYYVRLKDAMAEADRREREAFAGLRPKEYFLVNWQQYECPQCGHDLMVADHESGSGYRCLLCGETESEDIEHECDVCGETWPDWQLSSVDISDGDVDRICPHCRHDPDYVRDD